MIFFSFHFFKHRYGSDLVVVESYQQNNISERLAQEQLSSQPDAAFWLGLMSLDDLSTNTLEAASGSLVPQYAGKPMTCTSIPIAISIRQSSPEPSIKFHYCISC